MSEDRLDRGGKFLEDLVRNQGREKEVQPTVRSDVLILNPPELQPRKERRAKVGLGGKGNWQ